jgi:hypothetical protein
MVFRSIVEKFETVLDNTTTKGITRKDHQGKRVIPTTRNRRRETEEQGLIDTRRNQQRKEHAER